MSIKQFPGGIITKNPTVPTTSSAQGIWTVDQAQQYTKQGIWPRSPSAPTIGTATAGNSGCASITFSAPSCVGTGTLSYKLISTPGCFQNTGSSSPVVVSGLTSGTSYTFKAYGVTPGGTGPASAASNSITASNAGSQSYTAAGTYSWVAPSGVTSVSVVAVGGGGGGTSNYGTGRKSGSGGGLGYKNNYAVTPGNSYTVVVGAGGLGLAAVCAGNPGNCSYFVSTAVVKGGKGISAKSSGAGGTYTGDGGGCGGISGRGYSGGGGAGGYSGAGGAGAQCYTYGNAGAACGGGGGGGGGACGGLPAGGGGGVGLYGKGATGAGGTGLSAGGKKGSGGSDGGNPDAGNYGGGGGGGSYYVCCSCVTYYRGGNGGSGAVRILWPGNTRTFPSTCVGTP